MRTPTLTEITAHHHIVYPVPPASFSPLTATDAQLAHHGFPRRPNAETHPRLRSKWDRVMARRPRVIVPEFELISRFRTRPSGGGLAPGAAPATNDHWSGAVTSPPAGQAFNTVSGSWVVPNAGPPPSTWTSSGWSDGTYMVVTWIGIDGWGVTGSTDVLQAGTATQVTVSGGTPTVSTFAWYEWWTDLWIQFANFPVSAGDTIACTVCAPSTTHGFVAISNLTTGTATSVGVSPPSGVSLTGNCAEWIVERPTDAAGVLYTLPDYGATFFYDAVAGTPTREADLSGATAINMVVGGTTVSTGVVETTGIVTAYFGTNGP
jgi:hypothetical protein